MQQMEINRFLVRHVPFPGDESATIRSISQLFIYFAILSHHGTVSSFQFWRDSSLISRDTSQFLLANVLKVMEICRSSAPFQFWRGVLWINTSLPGDSLHLYPCWQRRKTADFRTRHVQNTSALHRSFSPSNQSNRHLLEARTKISLKFSIVLLGGDGKRANSEKGMIQSSLYHPVLRQTGRSRSRVDPKRT
jgi:hypothetical protein